VVLFAVCFTVGSAYALDFDTSGMYEARGTYIQNQSGLQNNNDGTSIPEKTADFGFYDHELDMTTRILVDDSTRIIVNYEIQDDIWRESNIDGRKVVPGDDLDNNIEFKRVFAAHTFQSTGTDLSVGLMTGGVWATDFANNANGVYRIRVEQTTPYGPLFLIYQKNRELGDNTAFSSVFGRDLEIDDENRDESDSLFLGYVWNAGKVNVKPLFVYTKNSFVDRNRNSDGLDAYTVQLGIDGAYDGWGFETDFVWSGTRFDDYADAPEDRDLYGAYGKAYVQFGAAQVYGLIGYGSEDEGVGFGFGDDFEPLVFIGYSNGFGGADDNDFQIAGSTLYMLGGNYAVSEKLSFQLAGAYIDSNMSAGSIWDGASAWEADVGLIYKITDALVYDMGFGVADFDLDEKTGLIDPDIGFRWYHRLKINF
jgi:hypothetical protein